jgi:hypothetical protein
VSTEDNDVNEMDSVAKCKKTHIPLFCTRDPQEKVVRIAEEEREMAKRASANLNSRKMVSLNEHYRCLLA